MSDVFPVCACGRQNSAGVCDHVVPLHGGGFTINNGYMPPAESVSPAPQRYKLELLKLGGCDMRHSDDGQYVLHSEYVSLREELADVKATNEELVRMVAKYKHERDDSRNIAKAEKLVREKAESQVADMRKALENALPYVSNWRQANEDGWIEKKNEVEKSIKKVLSHEA